MRALLVACLMFVMLLVGLAVGRASDRDETTVTAQVSSADHETAEGYFSPGPDTTVMAKPGSDLFTFLAREKGKQVRVTLTVVDGRERSRLDR